MTEAVVHAPAIPLESQLLHALETSPTESELRRLAEQGDAWLRVLQGLIEEGEERLTERSGDPACELAEIAAGLRRVESLRREAEEIRQLLRRLAVRTRALRAQWVAGTLSAR
jgi:hypothetical protein